MTRRRGRKRKTKPVTLAPTSITVIEVDNPMFARDHAESTTNPRRIAAAYNARESYAGWLVIKGLITTSEYEAASIVRAAFEAMGGAGASAMDYTKEPVDGGGMADPISERQMQAGQTLKQCAAHLGPRGHSLVISLAGEGRWPRDLAPGDRVKQDYLSMRFRECLESLAVLWGKQARMAVSKYRAESIP